MKFSLTIIRKAIKGGFSDIIIKNYPWGQHFENPEKKELVEKLVVSELEQYTDKFADLPKLIDFVNIAFFFAGPEAFKSIEFTNKRPLATISFSGGIKILAIKTKDKMVLFSNDLFNLEEKFDNKAVTEIDFLAQLKKLIFDNVVILQFTYGLEISSFIDQLEKMLLAKLGTIKTNEVQNFLKDVKEKLAKPAYVLEDKGIYKLVTKMVASDSRFNYSKGLEEKLLGYKRFKNQEDARVQQVRDKAILEKEKESLKKNDLSDDWWAEDEYISEESEEDYYGFIAKKKSQEEKPFYISHPIPLITTLFWKERDMRGEYKK